MMKATWSFVLYELRRHLPTLAVGFALLLIVPVVHRLVEGRWDYWHGEWKFAGAAAAALAIAPGLAVLMALSGWAGERSEGTLEWLYARPLSASRIFWIRLLAIFGATVVWTLVALLVNGSLRWDMLTAQFLSPGFMGLPLGLLWLILIGFALGGGLLASALFARTGSALLGFLIGALVLGYLIPFLLLLLVPIPSTLLFMGGEGAGFLAVRTYGSTMALALGLGAWVAMHRGPSDRRRLSRACKVTGALTGVAVLAFLALVLQPLRVDSSQTQRVCWLGEETILKFSRVPGIASFVYRSAPADGDAPVGPPRSISLATHPVLLDRDGTERPLRRIFALSHPVFAHSGRGLALMRHVEAGKLGWLLLDRRGTAQPLRIPERGEPQPIGWSHQGGFFAWRILSQLTKSRPVVSGLLILDEDFELRWLDVETPSPDWAAAWIDDRRLLLTPGWDYAGQARERGWWMVISVEGHQEVPPQPLPEETFLFPPALTFSPAHYSEVSGRSDFIHKSFLPMPSVSRDDQMVLLLSNGRGDTRLATLDLRNQELRLGQAISHIGSNLHNNAAFLASFGTLADGGLVWAEPAGSNRTRIMWMPPPPAEEPREGCTPSSYVSGSYRGGTGSWALWVDYVSGSRLYACHLGSGEVRVLEEEELGPFGARSVDVMEGGVLTTRGKIPLG